MRAEVAAAALDAGASLVNDVSGGLADPEMAALVAERSVPFVAMHWRGHSTRMQSRAHYDDVVADVVRELAERVEALVAAGVQPGCRRARPRVRVRQARRAQLGAAAPARRGRGPGPPGRSSARRARPSSAPWGAPREHGPSAAGARRRHRGDDRARRPPRRLVRARARRRRDGRRARRRRGARRPQAAGGQPRERRRTATASGCRGFGAAASTGCSSTSAARARSSSSTSSSRSTSPPAGATDDLADTVNYGAIGAAALARIEGEPHDLIERLAELVALGRPGPPGRRRGRPSPCTSPRRRSGCRSATSPCP